MITPATTAPNEVALKIVSICSNFKFLEHSGFLAIRNIKNPVTSTYTLTSVGYRYLTRNVREVGEASDIVEGRDCGVCRLRCVRIKGEWEHSGER